MLGLDGGRSVPKGPQDTEGLAEIWGRGGVAPWFREFLRSRRCSRGGLREGAAGVSRKSLDNVCSGTWNEENKHDPHRTSGPRAEPVLLPGEGKRAQTEGPARSRSPGRPRRSRRHRDGARGGPGPSAGVFGLPRAGTAGAAPPRAPQGLGKRLNPGEAGGGSRLTRLRPPTDRKSVV